ncbi:reverse transcriptase domain-containing protein, partial [Tanacetum coccineum]
AGFRADYGFVGTLDAKIRRDTDREIGYGITNVWVDPNEIVEKILATDVAELGQRMTDFITTIRHDTNEIYRRLDDAQDDRLLMSGQLNLLCTNRRSHVRTARLMENEARASREAWVKSMDASDMARSKTQMVALPSQQRPGRDPAHPDVPEEAGSSSKIWHDSGTGVRRQAHLSRECTYPDIMKCKPLYFKGTKGVVELTQWTVGHDVTYAMTYTNLKKMMTDKYCPKGEIKKLKVEMWNLNVKGTDVVSYNQHFQELALMCARIFPEESDKIKRYVSGLPDMIHGSVMESKPKTMQDAIKFATELMDKKIRTFTERLTLLGRVRRNLTEGLNLCAPNATITMMVSVLQNATSAIELAIWPVTIGVLQMPILLTTKGALGQVGMAMLHHKYMRSFVSTEFSSQIDITPTPLDHYYDVELADGRIISFDAITGMDWLAKYQTVIVCVEKIIPQKYMIKGCHVFLAHVTTKETEDKSEGKRLEDVSIVRYFPEVFPEDFLGLPSTRQVEFQIDLIPGAEHGHLINWPRPK